MWSTILFTSFFACQEETQSEKQNAESSKTEQKNTFQGTDLAALEKTAEEATVNLVPPPLELREELKKQGLKSDLAQFVIAKKLSTNIEDQDQLAIRAGVLITDLVLTVETAPIPELIEKMDALKIAFVKLKAGNDIGMVIDDLKSSLQAEGANRESILSEMNDLSTVMVSELKYEAGEWVVPLIQAGTWLEGSYIVSSAILKENNQKATVLLKKKGTAKYFLRYVNREGRSKAPAIIIGKLNATLNSLEEIANKKDISMEDVKKVQSLTRELMKFI